jgi:hypothetical protein
MSLVTSDPTQFNASHAKSRAIFLDQLQTFFGKVAGDNSTCVAHELSDKGGFAAGRGAQIQNRFAGARVEFARREQRAGVLDVKPAVTETCE